MEENDLPEILKSFHLWEDKIKNGENTISEKEIVNHHWYLVSKGQLAENGEFNLSVERYQTTQNLKTKSISKKAIG